MCGRMDSVYTWGHIPGVCKRFTAGNFFMCGKTFTQLFTREAQTGVYGQAIIFIYLSEPFECFIH